MMTLTDETGLSKLDLRAYELAGVELDERILSRARLRPARCWCGAETWGLTATCTPHYEPPADVRDLLSEEMLALLKKEAASA